MHARRILFIILSCLLLGVYTLSVVSGTTVHAQTSSTNISIGVGETSLVVTGRTSPGAFVTITEGGNISGTVNADTNGNFSHTFPAFTPGIHQISVYAQDTDNRTTDSVTKEVNVAEHLQTNLEFFLPPTLKFDSQALGPGEALQLSGSTIPGGQVNIVLDTTIIYQVVAGVDGTWSIRISGQSLSTGSHTLYAFTIDPISSAQGLASGLHLFTVLSPPAPNRPLTPGLPPPLTILPGPSIPVITWPQTGTTSHDANIVVRGHATPFSRVDLFDRDTPIGSAFTNASGDWQILLTLQNPSYDLRARACIQNKCSALSSSVQLFYIRPATARLSIQADHFWFQATTGEPTTQQLRVQGGVAPYRFTIDWGDGTSAQIATRNSTQAATHTYQQSGIFNVIAQVTDSSNQHAQLTYAVQVTTMPDFFQILLAILLILLVLSLLVWQLVRFFARKRSKDIRRKHLRKQ